MHHFISMPLKSMPACKQWATRLPHLLCRPAHAAYFATYEWAKVRLGTADQQDQSPHVFALAGMAATLASDAIATPLDVVKQRLQVISISARARWCSCLVTSLPSCSTLQQVAWVLPQVDALPSPISSRCRPSRAWSAGTVSLQAICPLRLIPKRSLLDITRQQPAHVLAVHVQSCPRHPLARRR